VARNRAAGRDAVWGVQCQRRFGLATWTFAEGGPRRKNELVEDDARGRMGLAPRSRRFLRFLRSVLDNIAHKRL